MSFQIRHLVVYGNDERQRILTFELGKLNIITGSSRRGKTAILTIIDYCLGSGDYPVKAGVTRRHSIGFGLMIVSEDRSLFVARPAPESGRATSDRMFVSVSANPDAIPSFAETEFNTNVSTAKNILEDLCGIDSTLRLPMPGNADPIAPTIRHSLFFVMQQQNEIANPDVLFHTQAEEYRPNAIRAVIPYFLGAVDTEYATLAIRLRTLKRELAALKRTLTDRAAALGATGQARALLAEAAAVGLLPELPPQTLSESDAIVSLRQVVLVETESVQDPSSHGDQLALVNARRAELRQRLNELNLQNTRLRRAVSENGDFVSEASEQRARLATLGFFGSEETEGDSCPFCGNEPADEGGPWSDLRQELERLGTEIVAVRTDTPKIDQMVAEIADESAIITQELRSNRAEIDELEAGMRAIGRLRETQGRTALVQGRIGFYLEMLDRRSQEPPIEDRTAELESEIATIEARLLENGNVDLLTTYLSLINRSLSEKARSLKLEHSDSPIRLDLRRLTVVADTRNGTVPLSEMGSGENWLGYHIATFLALHEWFVSERRPVPRVLIMDQPSQVWFPADYSGDGKHTLQDDDRDALLLVYGVILETVQALSPNFQVIVMEHADLEEPGFGESVQYRWRAPGEALIPADWINDDEEFSG
jgi:hypothetical protein